MFLHDELELESPKELAEESGKVLYDSMIKAGQIYCKEVPLGASGGITEVWGTLVNNQSNTINNN